MARCGRCGAVGAFFWVKRLTRGAGLGLGCRPRFLHLGDLAGKIHRSAGSMLDEEGHTAPNGGPWIGCSRQQSLVVAIGTATGAPVPPSRHRSLQRKHWTKYVGAVGHFRNTLPINHRPVFLSVSARSDLLPSQDRDNPGPHSLRFPGARARGRGEGGGCNLVEFSHISKIFGTLPVLRPGPHALVGFEVVKRRQGTDRSKFRACCATTRPNWFLDITGHTYQSWILVGSKGGSSARLL
ncbi:hypothetical protein GQ53DRAFT_355226 [Thozetella sp. PMI_491]|nr:hypothetical protein GQ53DRAFT_355226 [Thozetella sp. PMI_491]